MRRLIFWHVKISLSSWVPKTSADCLRMQ